MRFRIGFVIASAALLFWVGQGVRAQGQETNARDLALIALAASGDQDLGIATRIRELGPAGLPPLFALKEELQSRRAEVQNDETINQAIAAAISKSIARLDAIIDQVAGQRYASVSKLYWYTDLDQAQQAAAKTGKPILSLRMLGNLTEEYSCANSRFFRTTLYANEAISKRLAGGFILHWKSVRPAPRITIDYGDGRVVERTITGNSAHYLLAADGRPLDVLPGLYGPEQFLGWLDRVDAIHTGYVAASPAGKQDLLRGFHASRSRQIAADWEADLRTVLANRPEIAAGWDAMARVHERLLESPGDIRPVSFAGKAAAPADADPETARRDLIAALDQWDLMAAQDMWGALAALPEHSVAIDRASSLLIRDERPDAIFAGRLAFGKARVEDPLTRMIRNLQASIALDSVRNEYTMHRKIHDWFTTGEASANVEELNERVYTELFQTPSSDPWLGMVPPDEYSGLEEGGVVNNSR
jgi:hypothetical protein